MRILIQLLLIFQSASAMGQLPYSMRLPLFETVVYPQQVEHSKNKSITLAIPPPSHIVLGKGIDVLMLDSCTRLLTHIKVGVEYYESVNDLKLASDEMSNVYFAFVVDSSGLSKAFAQFVVGKLNSNGEVVWIRKVQLPKAYSESIFFRYISICSNNDDGVFLCFSLNQFVSSKFQTIIGQVELDKHGDIISSELYDNYEGIRQVKGCWTEEGLLYAAALCTNCGDERITVNKFKGGQQGAEVLPIMLSQTWVSSMSDITRDEKGNLYFLGESPNTSNQIIFSINKNGAPRWCYQYNSTFFQFSNLSYHNGYLSFIQQVGDVDQTSKRIVFDTIGYIVKAVESNSLPEGVPAIAMLDNSALAVFAEPNYYAVVDSVGWDGCDTIFQHASNFSGSSVKVKNGISRSILPKYNLVKAFDSESKVVKKSGGIEYHCNTGLFGSSLLADTLLCYGNELELSPEVFGDTAGIKYKWSTGATNKNLITNQSGLYKLNITNGACSHNHQTQVLMADEARNLVPDSLGLCPEDTGEIALNPLFKNSVYWYKPDSTIDENTSIKLKDEGPYYLNSMQAHCLEIDSVQVKPLNKKTVDAGQDSLICYGQEIRLKGSGAKKYNWQPSSIFTNGNDTLANPSIKPKADVKIKLQAVNLNGCAEEDSVLISVRDPLQIEIQQNDTSLCRGDSFILSAKATGGLAAQYEYVWNGSSTKSDSHSLQLSKSKNFILQLKDKCSEPAFDSIQLNVSEVEKSDIAYQPNPAMAGKIIQFSNPNPIYDSVKWMVNDTFFNQPTPNNHVFRREGEYQITQLIYQKGCADSNLLTLAVGDQLIYFYPTAFSPNGDGINDEWFIKGHSIANVELRIFNIWGERIFWFEGPQVKWDGTFRDQPAPIGDYIFMATLTASNGQKVEVQGEFAVVK